MSYVLPYIFLLGGFVLLVKGADVFVEGSSGIARFFKIPSIIIGLTIVAFGTSAPEAAVSITASITGQGGISVGNITGSNIFNVLMVLGVCALIKPITVQRSIMQKDYLLMLVASGALFAVSADMWLTGGDVQAMLSRGDGIILGLFFCIFLYMTIRSGLKGRKEEAPKIEETPQITEPVKEKKPEKKMSLPKGIIMAVLGLAGVVAGGELVVSGASDIARSFGASETLIGVTVVAIGTSLPELVTSIVASRKGENDIAVGNVVGSNIFNILFVLSASSIIRPIPMDMASIYDTIIMIGVCVMVYFFAVTKHKIMRWEGGLMVAMYAGYTAFAILRDVVW